LSVFINSYQLRSADFGLRALNSNSSLLISDGEKINKEETKLEARIPHSAIRNRMSPHSEIRNN